MRTATALANPNIAFIKYWGNKNHALRIPVNGSISMNLAGLHTRTRVTYDPSLPGDTLTVNGRQADEAALARVSTLLSRVRDLSRRGGLCRRRKPEQLPDRDRDRFLRRRIRRPEPGGQHSGRPAPQRTGAFSARPLRIRVGQPLNPFRFCRMAAGNGPRRFHTPSPSPRQTTGTWLTAWLWSAKRTKPPGPPRATPWPIPVPSRRPALPTPPAG